MTASDFAADVETPKTLVSALYDTISGPADAPRDWDRFQNLFQREARLMAFTTLPDGTPQEGVWTVDEFAREAAGFYRQAGFWEEELWSRTEQYGNVAHVLSTYESRVEAPDTEPVGRGVNSIQMVRHHGRWWITSVAFDLERPEEPIPDDYLPGSGAT